MAAMAVQAVTNFSTTLSPIIPGSNLTYRVHVKNNDGRHVHDIKTENNEKR